MAKVLVTASGSVALGNKDTVQVDINGGGNVLVQGDAAGGIQEIKIDLMGNDTFSDHVTVDLSTFDQDGLFIDLKNYDQTDQVSLQGATVTGLAPGTTDTLAFTYAGSDGLTHTGFAKIKDKGENDFTAPQNPLVICFAEGTAIGTQDGETRVEDISPGDLVATRDNGLRPVRWIGRRVMSAVDLALDPDIRPILIRKDALAPGRPDRDLSVSPQHRMVVQGVSDVLFGFDNALVAARHLVNDETVLWDTRAETVTYYHLLFDRHEIVFANGALSESLHPGDEAMNALDLEARAEVLALFPELEGVSAAARKTALPVLKAFEARVLAGFSA
ncbi:MAG: Hint domain-containing protein [Paracoccaceae bacterium]